MRNFLFTLFCLFTLASCQRHQSVVSGVDEREANTIIVFLDSKGISATKTQQSTSSAGNQNAAPKYNILVDEKHLIDAMAILNNNGLPRRQGITLLDLFSKSGLMTTDKEESIRYQAGLEQQITNMILMIDGVIDAVVQLSIPSQDQTNPDPTKERVTAAVYVKHQGIIDDPNSHLETKIKRLVSGSVNSLDINDVTVVSDRSRYTDVTPQMLEESQSSDQWVKIWSIVMSKESLLKFRLIFFLILIGVVFFGGACLWIVWKFYPSIKRHGGLRTLFNFRPFTNQEHEQQKASSEENLGSE